MPPESAAANFARQDRVLRQHVHDCEGLHADFEVLIDDLELQQAGIDVQYVVDFSEIYSYVLPDSHPIEFRIFHGDPLETTVAVQHYVLTKLFFDLRVQLVLIPPYALELKAFADHLRQRSPRDMIKQISEVQTASQTVRLHRDLPDIQDMMTRIAADDGNVDPKETERVLKFFERNAASLLRLVDQANENPLRRLYHLLEGSGLKPLAATIPDDLALDEALVENWEARLDFARGQRGASNRLDALAAATVHSANDVLRARGESTVLRLVTRSPQMHRVAREIASNRERGRRAEYFLRHPRAFVALRRTETGDVKQTLARLQVMQIALELVIEAYGPAAERDRSLPIEAERREKIKQLLANLRSNLYGGANLASIAAVSRNEAGAATPAGDARARILRVFELVNETKPLLERVEKEIAAMARTVDQSQQLLAIVMRSGPRPVVTTEPGSPVAQRSPGMNTRLYWMPYQLNFEDAELRQWQSEFRRRADMSLTEMLAYFQAGYRRGLDYETAMCLAYLLGAWDDWEGALKYCDISLAEHRLAGEERPANEPFFFKAVTLRAVFARNAAHYDEAEDLLTRAQAVRRAITGKDDARYTLEKAALMFYWARALGSTRGGGDRAQVDLRTREAVDLCKLAGDQAEGDRALRALVFNNLCFHFCEDAPDLHIDEIRAHLNAMERELASDPEEWPINFVDTALVARCRLATDRIDLSMWLRLIGIMERALSGGWVRSKDVAEFRRHIREASDFLPAGVLR
jgi:hypothetical protein